MLRFCGAVAVSHIQLAGYRDAPLILGLTVLMLERLRCAKTRAYTP